MRFEAVVEAARLTAPVELGGRRGETGDYLVVGAGPGVLFLKAATFETMFRPVNGAPPKAAREPKTDAEPGRKDGEIGRLILRALGEGPKLASAVADWMKAHGLPAYSNRKAGLSLGYQARRGRCELGKDRVWRLKG